MEPMIHKTTTTTVERQAPVRRAAINGLAVVGFIALVFIGITLAVYAARYIPESLSRLGAANVYFAEIFGGNDEDADLEVVPGDEVPFEEENPVVATSTDPVATTTTPTTPTTPTRPGTPVTVTVPITVPVQPYGKADLNVRVTEIGYLKSNTTDSFVKSRTVPEGKRPAVKFRVTNIGTNVSGNWDLEVKLPTSPTETKKWSQRSLAPNQPADFTIGYDRPRKGTNEIRIEVDADDDVDESNENNNVVTVDIEVED